jgi:hypothetical protein
VDGLGIKALARQFHHSRRKIREIPATPEPKRYVRLKPPPSILDPFKPIIDAILKADEQAPRGSNDIRPPNCGGGCSRNTATAAAMSACALSSSARGRASSDFIPLDHDPGQRLEVDFGHIYVDFPEGRRQVPASAGGSTVTIRRCLHLATRGPRRRGTFKAAPIHGLCFPDG